MTPIARPSALRARLAIATVVGLLAVSTTQAGFVIDLTTAGSSGSAHGGLFNQVDPQPTGTGYIDPFVRIQRTGAERGYNTEGQIEFDTKDDGGHNWTHSLLLSDLHSITLDGSQYYKFSLDINEKGSDAGRLLSMNDFRLYLGNAGDLTGWADGFGSDSVKVYDIDAGDNNGDGVVNADDDATVELDYKLNHGSGSGDMSVYILASLFQGHAGEFQYVYLYSAFGHPHGSDAGFEEWWAEKGESEPPVVPAPASALLLLTGVPGLGLAWYRRRRAARA